MQAKEAFIANPCRIDKDYVLLARLIDSSLPRDPSFCLEN